MRWSKSLTMVEAHAEGEVGRVVTAGAPLIPGDSMLEKMNYLNEVDESLRRFLVLEPRGQAQMSTDLLLPSTRPDADVGFIVLQGDKAHAMSGSNTICVVTVLLETGRIPMKEPETIVRLDTPAGLVVAKAACKDGKCLNVSLDMVPSFAVETNVNLEVPGVGRVSADIAFGGVFYALVDPKTLGLKIEPSQARKLVHIGSEITRAFRQAYSVEHPQSPSLRGITYTMFVDHKNDGDMIGATVIPPGRLDRSPCGTGNLARLAVMHARGEAKVGDSFCAFSTINSKFDVKIKEEVDVAGRRSIIPVVTGRGWIHGIHQVGLDPTDPYPKGFSISDCWGEATDLLL